jgi:hypothetical protein
MGEIWVGVRGRNGWVGENEREGERKGGIDGREWEVNGILG